MVKSWISTPRSSHFPFHYSILRTSWWKVVLLQNFPVALGPLSGKQEKLLHSLVKISKILSQKIADSISSELLHTVRNLPLIHPLRSFHSSTGNVSCSCYQYSGLQEDPGIEQGFWGAPKTQIGCRRAPHVFICINNTAPHIGGNEGGFQVLNWFNSILCQCIVSPPAIMPSSAFCKRSRRLCTSMQIQVMATP